MFGVETSCGFVVKFSASFNKSLHIKQPSFNLRQAMFSSFMEKSTDKLAAGLDINKLTGHLAVNNLAVCVAGMVAEKLVLGNISTANSDDLQKVVCLAKQIVRY